MAIVLVVNVLPRNVIIDVGSVAAFTAQRGGKKLLPLFRIEEHHPNWNLSPGVVGVISHRLPPQYLARHRIRYKQRRATRPIVAAFEHDALPKDAAPAGCDAFGTPGGLSLIAIDFGLRVAINSPEQIGRKSVV